MGESDAHGSPSRPADEAEAILVGSKVTTAEFLGTAMGRRP